MEIIYLPKAGEDLEYWIKAGNKMILKKIAQITEAILKNPFEGIGKPERLKYDLTGKWSRRISQEHRFVYSVVNDRIIIYSPKDHYLE
jgi:toxin YoeB